MFICMCLGTAGVLIAISWYIFFFGRVGFWAKAKIEHIVWNIFGTNCLDEIVV
jgi:hypothetical protein